MYLIQKTISFVIEHPVDGLSQRQAIAQQATGIPCPLDDTPPPPVNLISILRTATEFTTDNQSMLLMLNTQCSIVHILFSLTYLP